MQLITGRVQGHDSSRRVAQIEPLETAIVRNCVCKWTELWDRGLPVLNDDRASTLSVRIDVRRNWIYLETSGNLQRITPYFPS